MSQVHVLFMCLLQAGWFFRSEAALIQIAGFQIQQAAKLNTTLCLFVECVIN